MAKTRDKWQFGDFQTPKELSDRAMVVLRESGFRPKTIIEPTCGKGSFLYSAHKAFPNAQNIVGIEINPNYVQEALKEREKQKRAETIQIIEDDFFKFDWKTVIDNSQGHVLIVGNPPWVTNSELGMLGSKNLPAKSNFQNRNGFDAITGKSNFDISEWMIIKYLEWLEGKKGTIAVLCKSAVARKILLNIWQSNYEVSASRIYNIDAKRFFDASVDASFLVIEKSDKISSKCECTVYPSLDNAQSYHTFGFHDGLLLADVELYEKNKQLKGKDDAYVWRSGVKHDCSKVMELERVNGHYINGLKETVGIEDTYIFPMLKSSHIANGEIRYGKKCMLVTQSYVGEDTSHIQTDAPKTWHYLFKHADHLDRRGSSIYRNRPRFSVFGVGDYTFSPYKIAISGFYKNLRFKLINQLDGKPVVFDDTVNFLACWSEDEAQWLFNLLNSEPAQEYLNSMIFWQEKRPITIEILKRLSIKNLAEQHGSLKKYAEFSRHRSLEAKYETTGQLFLVLEEERQKYLCKA